VLWWPGEHVIFVEAKLCATNTTWPRPKAGGDDHRPTAYSDNTHFPSVLRGTYEEIAVEARKYELMRMWLLGTWIAMTDGASFSLVNLVCWINEMDIEQRFGGRFCRQDARRTFVRANWEDVWEALPASGLSRETIEMLDTYFGDKTAGYHSGGLLCRAFVDSAERRPA
jgi:hypothetical protein